MGWDEFLGPNVQSTMQPWKIVWNYQDSWEIPLPVRMLLTGFPPGYYDTIWEEDGRDKATVFSKDRRWRLCWTDALNFRRKIGNFRTFFELPIRRHESRAHEEFKVVFGKKNVSGVDVTELLVQDFEIFRTALNRTRKVFSRSSWAIGKKFLDVSLYLPFSGSVIDVVITGVQGEG